MVKVHIDITPQFLIPIEIVDEGALWLGESTATCTQGKLLHSCKRRMCRMSLVPFSLKVHQVEKE